MGQVGPGGALRAARGDLAAARPVICARPGHPRSPRLRAAARSLAVGARAGAASERRRGGACAGRRRARRQADGSGLARPRGSRCGRRACSRGASDAVELLRESVAVLDGSPARYERAKSLVALGGALRRGGRRADARGPLADGLELAFRCGAERLVEPRREELLATGARPRSIVRSGFDALTASERRVVRLAAAGALERRHRPDPLSERQDRRAPPLGRLRQARHHRPGRSPPAGRAHPAARLTGRKR